MKKSLLPACRVHLLVWGLAALFALACATKTYRSESDPLSSIRIIPEPQSIELHTGTFTVDSGTALIAVPELREVAQFIKEDFAAATGLALNGSQNKIMLSLDKKVSTSPEGYLLNVMEHLVTVQAPSAAGIFYGYQTLKQLMPTSVFKKQSGVSSFPLPCVEIADAPRFAWRGLMLDSSRHFQSVDDIKTFIDLLAMHKMNSFHWHLTEDQGWRIEIKKYPELTQKGSVRKQTLKGNNFNKPQFDGTPYGGFYTQAEAKEIVAYAAKRFINVVPEIELPGHAQAAVSVYPQYGNTGNTQLGVRELWGVSEEVYNVNDETIAFLKDIFDEIFEIFPGQYIHVGGDECPKTQWKASPEAQARIKAEGLKDEYELQSWFIQNFADYFEAHGRHLIGWDEILEGRLPGGACVMSWRGEKGGIKAAKMGHKVVMSPNTYVYLDYYQTRDTADEPLNIGGYLPLFNIYQFNPISKRIPKKYHSYVLGGQGNVWTEYMKDMDQVLYMAWPRAAAISECVWCDSSKKNFGKFVYKLEQAHYQRLANAGIPFRFPDTDKTLIPYQKAADAAFAEISLPPSETGFYQLFIKSASAFSTASQAQLCIDNKPVDTHKRSGVIEDFVQGTLYTLSADPALISAAEPGHITARLYLSANDGKSDLSGEVVVKTLTAPTE